MKHSELKQIIKEEIEAILAEDLNNKKGRRFIPTVIPFSKNIRDQFAEHFKLVKGTDGDYKLYISPMMKVALEGIQRGRTSQDTRSRAGELVNKISDKIPNNVRAILKNFSDKLNPSVNMYSVNSKIADVKDGDINFYNPSNPQTADKAYDPIISENTEHYMFFENLKIIKDNVDKLLQMDKMNIEALLSNGHDWAADHIATSKDDVEEVYNFFMTKISSVNEKMLSDKQMQIAKAAPPKDKITGADFAALRKK